MICKKCGESFKVKQWIDGKLRNMANRKYCLECSPFGQHNTRRIEEGSSPKRRLNRDPQYVKRKRTEKKFKLIKYRGGRCKKCGYDKPIAGAYAFHHRDPSTKEFGIASAISLSIETLRREVDKCDLYCLLCHAELHHDIWGGDKISE
jgi:hypothetical protein